MNRVTGIGGIFFTARDPGSLRYWYRTHLGLDAQPEYGKYRWVIDPAGKKVELWEPPPGR